MKKMQKQDKTFTGTFAVKAETEGRQNKELLKLQQQYRKDPTPALRRKIFELSGK